MFGSTILDVAIGLVFVYCLYSLLASIIKEIIASILGLRASKLKRAIGRMLIDSPDDTSPISKLLFKKFFSHPLIKYMNDGGKFDRKPSYISPESFSKVILDILTEMGSKEEVRSLTPSNISAGIKNLASKNNNETGQKQSDTIYLIESFFIDANNDIMKFRASLEKWFNEMMERVSGWYKRQVQWIVFIIGFCIAASFNVDTFKIVHNLSKDKTAREQMVQLATNYVKNHPSGISNHSRDSVLINQKLDSLVIFADSLYKADITESNQLLGIGWNDCISWESLLGWLITALAISLGAPFWFDLLSKLVRLRGTGPKPEETKKVSNTDISIIQRKG